MSEWDRFGGIGIFRDCLPIPCRSTPCVLHAVNIICNFAELVVRELERDKVGGRAGLGVRKLKASCSWRVGAPLGAFCVQRATM